MADASAYWRRPTLNNSVYIAYIYAIWDGTGIVWALAAQSGFTNVQTTTTVTDPNYMLLENSSTYIRSASHYCVAIAKITFQYDTGDNPDYTIDTTKSFIIYGHDSEDAYDKAYFVASLAGTQGAMGVNANNRIPMNTIVKDPFGKFDTAKYKWTVPVSGLYFIHESFYAKANTTNQGVGIYLGVNCTDENPPLSCSANYQIHYMTQYVNATSYNNMNGEFPIWLNKDDTILLLVGGYNITIYDVGGVNYFSANLLSR